MDVPANLIARGKWPQLLTNKFAERLLTRHALCFLRVRKLMLGECAKCSSQHFTIQSVLAFEVVINRGLVDVGLCSFGPPTSRFVTAGARLGEIALPGGREEPLRQLVSLLARALRTRRAGSSR